MGDLSDMMPGQSDQGGIKWGHMAAGAAIGYGLGHQIRNINNQPDLRRLQEEQDAYQQAMYLSQGVMSNDYMQGMERQWKAHVRAVGIIMLIKMLVLWGIIGYGVWWMFFSDHT